MAQKNRVTVFVVVLFCLSICAVANAGGQQHMEKIADAKTVVLKYLLRDQRGSTHDLVFRLDRSAVGAAQQMFQPLDTDDLRAQAQARAVVLTRKLVDDLAREYPDAEFTIGANNSIRRHVGGPDDYRNLRQQHFEQQLEEQIRIIESRFPGASISKAPAGGYTLSADSQVQLHRVRAAMREAVERVQDQVDQADAAEMARIRQQSDALSQQIRAELDDISRQMEGFQQDYFQARWYRTYKENSLLPDYARIAQAALPGLEPMTEPLRNWLRGLSQREAINRLLFFVQSIPYDELQDRAHDSGFLVPMDVLVENRGDCDSKSVLFAALLHHLYPQLEVGMVVLKNHALVALGVPVAAADTTLSRWGKRWVLAEPVGPRISPLGRAGEEYRADPRVEAFIRIF